METLLSRGKFMEKIKYIKIINLMMIVPKFNIKV
jgi:hypothetical protein